MSNRFFTIFILFLLAVGFLAGWIFSRRPSFSVPAMLNLAGLAYSIIAVIVLYEEFSQNQTYKVFVISKFAPCLLWAHMIVPLGIALSWLIIRGTPHGNRIANFGFSFFVYSMLPLAFLDATVVFPRIAKIQSISDRHQRFGLFLLLSGLGMQFIAALATL